MEVSNEKDRLREEFEVKSQNIVNILKKEDIQQRDRDMVLNLLKVWRYH